MVEEDSPAAKRQRAANTEVHSSNDFSEEDVMAWLSVDGKEEEAESVDELSKLLLDSPADSCSGSSGTTAVAPLVRFIADPDWSPVVFQSSTSYVTINGNEESCGSSFSEGESSVMASVDTRGMVNVSSGVAWGTSEKGMGMDGWDGFVDWDWEHCGLSEAEVASFLGE